MPTSEQKRCERAYQRGFGSFQVRTAAGRLVAHACNVEAVEFRLYEGRARLLWRRLHDFGRVVWLSERGE